MRAIDSRAAWPHPGEPSGSQIGRFQEQHENSRHPIPRRRGAGSAGRLRRPEGPTRRAGPRLGSRGDLGSSPRAAAQRRAPEAATSDSRPSSAGAPGPPARNVEHARLRHGAPAGALTHRALSASHLPRSPLSANRSESAPCKASQRSRCKSGPRRCRYTLVATRETARATDPSEPRGQRSALGGSASVRAATLVKPEQAPKG